MIRKRIDGGSKNLIYFNGTDIYYFICQTDLDSLFLN